MTQGAEPRRGRDAESVFADFLARREEGEAIEFESVLVEHPAAERELRALLADHERFAPMFEHAFPGGFVEGSRAPLLGERAALGIEDQAALERLRKKLALFTTNGGRYRFRRLVGRGTFGAVVEVWDRTLNRTLAVKVQLGRDEELVPGSAPEHDPERAMRFLQEAEIVGQLDHPGVVPIHELGADDKGRPYFTMRLVKGVTFESVIADVHADPPRRSLVEALNDLVKVCETVAYAHSRGVVHRDLKPANVMVGEFGAAYVMDWGLACVLGEARESLRTIRSESASTLDGENGGTASGRILGTPAYMPPEQARGSIEDVDARADVYALGAILYHLLAGRAPYTREGSPSTAQDIVTRVIAAPPEALTVIARHAPAKLVSIAERAMNRVPSKRYAGAELIAADLRAFLDLRVVSAYEGGTWAEARTWIRRNRALSLAMGTAVLALVAGALAARGSAVLANEKQAATERSARAELDTSRAIESARLERIKALFRSVEVATQRREFQAVIANLRDLREFQGVDLVECGLREARALLAVWDHPAALEVLRELEAREDLGTRRGAVLLLMAEAGLSRGDLEKDWTEWVREAQSFPLSPSERSFSEGLLEETPAASLAKFERALDHDPLHQGAGSCVLFLYFMHGRFSDARTVGELFSRAFPLDPSYPLALEVVHILSGATPVGGVTDNTMSLVAGLNTQDASLARLIPGIDLALTDLRSVRATNAAAGISDLAQRVLALANRLGGKGESLAPGFGLVALPCLRTSWGKALEALLVMSVDPASAQRLFREASATHTEAFFSFGEASLAFLRAPPSPGLGGSIYRLAEAESVFEVGANAPSIFPAARETCLYWAALHQALLASNKVGADASYRSKAIASMTNLLDVGPEWDSAFGLLASYAFSRLEEPDLARRLQERVVRADPTALPQVTKLATFEFESGMHGRALKRVDRILAECPGDKDAVELRTRIVAAAHEIR